MTYKQGIKSKLLIANFILVHTITIQYLTWFKSELWIFLHQFLQ